MAETALSRQRPGQLTAEEIFIDQPSAPPLECGIPRSPETYPLTLLIAAPTVATAPTGAFQATAPTAPPTGATENPEPPKKTPSAIAATRPAAPSTSNQYASSMPPSWWCPTESPHEPSGPNQASRILRPPGRRPGSAWPQSRARPAESTNAWSARVVRSAVFTRAPLPPSAQYMACGSWHGP